MTTVFKEGYPADTGVSPEAAAESAAAIVIVGQRHKHLLFRQRLSDVVFAAGACRDEIYAHSYLLCEASDVFLTMFSKPWKNEDAVVIADFEPVIVESLLRWIYCNELIFVPGTLVLVMRIAHKYMVHSLISFVTTNFATVDKKFIWSFHTMALQFKLQDLVTKSMAVITSNPVHYLDSADFLNASCESVTAFASLEQSVVTEMHLFTRCLEWSKKECERQELELLPENQRLVMEPFIYQIAFPSMPPPEFAGLPCESGVLTDAEQLAILRIKNGREAESKFRKAARHGKTCRNWKTGNEYLFRCNQCSRCVCNDCFITSADNAEKHTCFRNNNGYAWTRYSYSRDNCSGSR